MHLNLNFFIRFEMYNRYCSNNSQSFRKKSELILYKNENEAFSRSDCGNYIVYFGDFHCSLLPNSFNSNKFDENWEVDNDSDFAEN